MRAGHQAIADAIASRDSDTAQRLHREHLHRTRHLLLNPGTQPKQ